MYGKKFELSRPVQNLDTMNQAVEEHKVRGCQISKRISTNQSISMQMGMEVGEYVR